MPRFYFHLKDGSDRLLDPQGQVIETVDQIGTIALVEARSLISQDVLNGIINLGQRLDVEAEDGRVVYSLPFADAVRIVEKPETG